MVNFRYRSPSVLASKGWTRDAYKKISQLKAGSVLLALFVGLGFQACINPQKTIELGIQEPYEAYIPARIAVMNCKTWPVNARFKGLTPINISEEAKTNLCKEYDDFVLRSFSGQAFMNGFTPKLIRKLLNKNNQSELIEQIPLIWNFDQKSCPSCTTPQQTYHDSLAKDIKWRAWLNTLSKNVRFADAALFPFIIDSYENRYDDRGLWIAERVIHISLLLIDTNNANLLWAGERKSVLSNQGLAQKTQKSQIPYPDWSNLHQRIFIKELWKDFPGRLEDL